MSFTTAADYLTEARRLLQDETAPYRYPDVDMLGALNLAVLEARRLRPDLFLSNFSALPNVSTTGSAISIEPMYQSALVYYVVGRMELRDAEDDKDARASNLMNKFVGQLISLPA